MDLNRLKRFNQSKHEQLEQLIAWSQMMGLTGKDLVSLGGHIARAQAKEEAKRNIDLVDNMGCLPIGKDQGIEQRWKYKHGDVIYHFDLHGYSPKIVNTKTKAQITVRPSRSQELGRMRWGKAERYFIMLDITEGKIKLP